MQDYKFEKIIKIEPVEKTFAITWRPNIKCNYDCMYCSYDWHSDNDDLKSLEELQTVWQKIYQSSKHKNLKYKIGFTGGEILINKNFMPFIKWLKEKFGNQIEQMGVTTNGSASKRYYLELIEYVDYICFSTHSEFFNEKNFFDTVVACNLKIKNTSKTIHVNIMDEPWHRDRIKIYNDFLTKRKISHTIQPIVWEHKIRNFHLENKNNSFFNFTDD